MSTVQEYLDHSLKGALRIGQTVRILGQTGLSWVFGHRPPTPRLIRETFEHLGTTYIKLGQFIASSPSIFPDEYVEEFQRCLDKTKPLPFRMMKDVLEEDLGRPLSRIFSEINPNPIASASIAQVYSAKLISGEEVVIKIQKPGVRNILLTDLNFLFVGAKMLEFLVPGLAMASLSDIVAEIQKGMLEECNFLKEADNIRDFQNFLIQTGNDQAVAPNVYEHATTLRVLTMERLHGVPFTDLDTIRKYSRNPEATLIAAMNTWFASLMFCTSFHADVHAGNLLVLRDGRIGFIDFGIVGRIKRETWQSVSDFIFSVTQEDYEGMARSMVGIGMTKEEVDIERLTHDIEAMYETLDKIDPDTLLAPAAVSENEINRLMLDLIGIGKRHGIHFPREFALLLKQLLYFDRYVRLLNVEQNIYSDNRLTITPDERWIGVY